MNLYVNEKEYCDYNDDVANNNKKLYNDTKNLKEFELNEDHIRSYNSSMNPSKTSKSNVNVIIKTIKKKKFFRFD